MAQPALKLLGATQTMFALQELPKRVYFLHQRIALNAAGGVIRDEAKARVRRRTGLLAKSMGVKVTIPDASRDKRHHGKPAYVVIGPKRKSGRMMLIGKSGRLRGFGAAQRLLVAKRGRQKEAGVKPLERERNAVKETLKTIRAARYINPTRYAHLLEKGHSRGRGRSSAKPYPFLGPAVSAARERAIAAFQRKIKQGIEQEAFGLSKQVFAGA